VNITSLARTGTVTRVEVVGSNAPLSFTQDGTGLHVSVPPAASHDFGVALKITGSGLV
jgi:alpha-L-fucosidase